MSLEQFKPLERIFLSDSQGTKAYFVLSGLVRMLERIVDPV
jgi:hypothetical protein